MTENYLQILPASIESSIPAIVNLEAIVSGGKFKIGAQFSPRTMTNHRARRELAFHFGSIKSPKKKDYTFSFTCNPKILSCFGGFILRNVCVGFHLFSYRRVIKVIKQAFATFRFIFNYIDFFLSSSRNVMTDPAKCQPIRPRPEQAGCDVTSALREGSQ